MNTSVFPVIFKRNRKSKTERGIGIGSDPGNVEIIVDSKYKSNQLKHQFGLLSACHKKACSLFN